MPNYGIGYNGECDDKQDFETYLKDEVFTFGTYTYSDASDTYGDIKVAEWDDGMGFIMKSDIESVISDDGVKICCIDNGWLCLRDER